jgi:hypothetical protein
MAPADDETVKTRDAVQWAQDIIGVPLQVRIATATLPWLMVPSALVAGELPAYVFGVGTIVMGAVTIVLANFVFQKLHRLGLRSMWRAPLGYGKVAAWILFLPHGEATLKERRVCRVFATGFAALSAAIAVHATLST